jgi:hypothetical protein
VAGGVVEEPLLGEEREALCRARGRRAVERQAEVALVGRHGQVDGALGGDGVGVRRGADVDDLAACGVGRGVVARHRAVGVGARRGCGRGRGGVLARRGGAAGGGVRGVVLPTTEDAGAEQDHPRHDQGGDEGRDDAHVASASLGQLGAAVELPLQVALGGLTALLVRGHGFVCSSRGVVRGQPASLGAVPGRSPDAAGSTVRPA